MLEGTRIVPVYFRYDGLEEPRFGDEIDDEGFGTYAYDGWLPLQLSGKADDGRQHATLIGDPWLTTPPSATAPPEPGPAPVRITAAECKAELFERARLGLRYFMEENPEDISQYDRNWIANDIGEAYEAAMKTLRIDLEARTAFDETRIARIEVTISGIKRVRFAGVAETHVTSVNETHYDAVKDFIATHQHELIEHLHKRIRDGRRQLRDLMDAGRRLRAFDD